MNATDPKKGSTTVRITCANKAKLEHLARHSYRGLMHMLALLIEREYEAVVAKNAPRNRKAG